MEKAMLSGSWREIEMLKEAKIYSYVVKEGGRQEGRKEGRKAWILEIE